MVAWTVHQLDSFTFLRQFIEQIMNRTIKKATKDKGQLHSLDAYFPKAQHPIYIERLREEANKLLESSSSQPTDEKENGNPFEEAEKQVDSSCGQPTNDEKSVVEIGSLASKVEFLEKKCADLQQQNTKLVTDNRALKKMFDASKNFNLFKGLKIQTLKSNSGDDPKIKSNVVCEARASIYI